MDVKEFKKLIGKNKVDGQGRLMFAPNEVPVSADKPMSRFDAALAKEKEEKPKQHHVMYEDNLQMAIMNEMDRLYPSYSALLVHNCNEFNGNERSGAKRKKMGVRKGFPDLSFFVPSVYYHGLHIELKHGRNTQSEEQKKYQQLLEKSGYQYVVCRSVEDFIKGISEYITVGRYGG